MTQLANPRIAVTGGRGFLGRAVCRAAAQAGLDVLSFGRSPCPPAGSLPPNVHCRQADLFDPAAWAPYLDGCTAVVHTVGTLVENPAEGRTYERLIFQAAKVAGDMAVKLGVPRFVFVSADGPRPGTPPSYMDNKRRAEAYLAKLAFTLVVARPSLIYGADRPESLAARQRIERLARLPFVGPRLVRSRPLSVETVARALVRAALDPSVRGVLQIEDLERLGKA
jgi:uncharacterized protein YbjT (DUF2867 family)